MPAGRPRKPTALRLVEGNRSKKPLPTNEPIAPVSPNQPPEGLDGDALTCWDRLHPILCGMSVLTIADREALTETCICYAELAAARRSLAQPLFVPDEKRPGQTIQVAAAGDVVFQTLSRDGVPVKARAEIAIIEAAARRYRDYLVQFGMTPAARSRVQTIGKKETSNAAKYF